MTRSRWPALLTLLTATMLSLGAAARATADTITTVAGNGFGGFSGDGGLATSASLSFPNGVALDAAGNVFIADTQNHRIRKISAGGIITTVAGTSSPGFIG